MRTRIWIFWVVALLLTVFLDAQSPGEIHGVVRDVSGGVLPGVTVEARSPALIEGVRSTVTDPNGAYRLQALPIGTYTLRFSLPGFTTVVREGIVLTTGFQARVDAELKVGEVTETVIVTAEAPTVDVMNARQVTVLSGQEIRDLPTSRNLSGLIALQPGLGYASYGREPNHESYAAIEENVFHRPTDAPLSTFSIDVDTASYANVRRFLNEGTMPPADAVRVEELVNYFRFDYPQPGGDAPFSITTELTDAPWNADHRLVLVGLQGRHVEDRDIPARNLVFLLDVSGSMTSADKLPLVQRAMRLLVDTLDARDRVAIVVYAGQSGLVLPSTPGDRKEEIHQAIARLHAGGSTNGGAGIELAYRIAQEQFLDGGVNRVILATDGDFNVGLTNRDALQRLIEEKRASGIFLSVLGVGTGNIRDDTMEMLANHGNGNYSYLDSLQEARKVLVREAGGTLVTIASDVKIQVEFNPATVAAYRLIGYENRLLAAEDFNDDTKDAGEIGSGHSVTALYEIVPAGRAVEGAPAVDPLRYQTARGPASFPDELLAVKVRYKRPGEDRSRLLTTVVQNRVRPPSPNVGFASAVAEFGLMLRGSQFHAGNDVGALTDRARRFRGDDAEGYRAEFIRLVELAAGLRGIDGPQNDTRQ